MNRRQFRALIALNVLLLAVLAAVSLAPAAGAQGARARGSYTMVGGQIQGREEAAIYIIDATNQELVALSWDRGRNGLTPLGYRNIADDARRPVGGGR